LELPVAGNHDISTEFAVTVPSVSVVTEGRTGGGVIEIIKFSIFEITQKNSLNLIG